MNKINPTKRSFVDIGGEEVYKLFVRDKLYYKILREEAVGSFYLNDDHEIYPQFFIYEIDVSIYTSLRILMEGCGYYPFLNRYNDRFLRYLAEQFFPHADMALQGFSINKLIREVRTDASFLNTLRSEDC